MILSIFTENGEKKIQRDLLKGYPKRSFSLNFGHPFDSRGCLKFRLGNLLSLRLYFLPARTVNVIKPNRFCYYVQKGHGFYRENLVSVIVSTFLLFMFVDQLLLVDVFSQLCYLTDAKNKTTMSNLPLQIVKIMKNR